MANYMTQSNRELCLELKKQGLTQRQMAERLNVSRNTIQRLLNADKGDLARKCRFCGKEFSPWSINVFYCSPECKTTAKVMRNRANAKKRREQDIALQKEKKKDAKKRKRTLADFNDKARAMGMTYGQYQAWLTIHGGEEHGGI